MFYTEAGKGFPLVLLHGNGESSAYFSSQIKYFSKSLRVIAPDTRGHGNSERGDAPFTLAAFAEDLKELLDSLGILKVFLLGFSDGANIAMLFALKYPEYVEKLILNGGNLYPSGVRASVQLPICIGFFVVLIISFFDKKAKAKSEMLALMVKQPHIKESELSRLAIPTLVIVGTHDMIKDSHSRKIAAALLCGQLVRIPGGHFIAAENSDSFNKAVECFLDI